jgi:transposase
MGPSMAVEGVTTSRVFETYVERLLAPTLKPGQIVVMDKAVSAHDVRGFFAHCGYRIPAQ